MANKQRSSRWLDNPQHRVGDECLLRALRAALGESDERYQRLKRQLQERGDRVHQSAAPDA
jgi:hypothetical protein